MPSSAVLVWALIGCANRQANGEADEPPETAEVTTIEVRQAAGKRVTWVLPGPRRLEERVFGTSANPKRTGELPKEIDPGVRELLEQVPYLVGVPVELREETEEGQLQTRFATPFSEQVARVRGRLELVLRDSVSGDLSGPPTETSDRVEIDAAFTDPGGHEYEVRLTTVFQPPIPGYETDGGVLVAGKLAGATGTGSPLWPELYTYAAFWALADLEIDGRIVGTDHLVHFATTEVVRDRRGRLATTDELPIAPKDAVAGQVHQTHGFVLPVRYVDGQLRYDPVPTAHELPDGTKQEFVHVIYEQDVIVEGPAFAPPGRG